MLALFVPPLKVRTTRRAITIAPPHFITAGTRPYDRHRVPTAPDVELEDGEAVVGVVVGHPFDGALHGSIRRGRRCHGGIIHGFAGELRRRRAVPAPRPRRAFGRGGRETAHRCGERRNVATPSRVCPVSMCHYPLFQSLPRTHDGMCELTTPQPDS